MKSFDAITHRDNVRQALTFIEQNEPEVIRKQVALCEVPSPPFKENERARFFAGLFRQIGAREVEIDEAGNVVVKRTGKKGGPPVVLAAHLDTVFPEGTDVTVEKEGRVYRAPGIGDNSRGLAVLLGIFEALEKNRIATEHDIIFLGDVGEEGLGNLRGVRHFMERCRDPRAFISFDGSGNETICYLALSTYRYRVAYKGPGGHAYNNYGRPSANNAMGRAIAKAADLKLPEEPKTILNIGVVKGGSAVNAIAEYAEMLVDIRSADPAVLESVKERFLTAVMEALDDENRHKAEQLEVETECLGYRPGGTQPEDSAIVKMAVEVTKSLGMEPVLEGFKSTTANLPLSLGIPSLTLGSGGYYRGEHSENEEWDSQDSHKAVQRGVLLALLLAGLVDK